MYDDHPTSIDVVVAVNCTRTRPTATPRTADSFPSDAPYAPGAKALETLYAHFKVLLLTGTGAAALLAWYAKCSIDWYSSYVTSE